MKTLDGILYRFRGYVLGALAIALCILPARQIEIACAPDAPTTTAFILCLAGILLRIKTRQFIGEHTRGSIHAADILVKAGPYACTRHPLYISNTLIALSAILLWSSCSNSSSPMPKTGFSKGSSATNGGNGNPAR